MGGIELLTISCPQKLKLSSLFVDLSLPNAVLLINRFSRSLLNMVVSSLPPSAQLSAEACHNHSGHHLYRIATDNCLMSLDRTRALWCAEG